MRRVVRGGVIKNQEDTHQNQPLVFGAGGRDRTGMGLVGPRDFKSSLLVETIERELREPAPDEELGEGWAYAE